MFAALGRFDYRFRRVLPVLALAVVIGLNVWASLGGGKLIQGGWQVPNSQAEQADALLASRFGKTATSMLVIYRSTDGAASSPGFEQKVIDSLSAVKADPSVESVITYGATRDPKLLSTDGTATLAVVQLNKGLDAAVEDSARLAAAVKTPVGATVTITGVPQVYHEFNTKIEKDLVTAEMISFPVALLILLVVFGTVVGAGLPLLIAFAGLLSTFAVIRLLAAVIDMSIFVNNVASMIGIALAIDYSLFMVSRFREELRHHSVEVAIERMMATVGKAVAISGVAVAIGLSSLAVFEADALRSMGIGGIVTVVSTLVFGLTVLPAILGMLGPRVNRWRVPLPSSLRLMEDDPQLADQRQGHGAWSRIASNVMRRPLLIAGPVLVLLLLAGSPFLSLSLSTGGNLSDLPRSPARDGFEYLAAAFPGGESDPVVVAVTYPGAHLADGLTAAQVAGLQRYASSLGALSTVKSVSGPLDPPADMAAADYLKLIGAPAAQRPAALSRWTAQTLAGDTARFEVFSSVLPDSQPGRALVDAVRGVPAPSGARVLTAGLSSRSHDFIQSFNHSVPVAVLIVIVVTGGVLFLTFGSVLLPLKAVLMSLISVSASFGALVFIFQQGHLSNVLGFDPTAATAAWLPVIMFAILFGLSMDYEVLLLSRIRERYLATGDNTRAVAEGIGITGGIITGAALIMVAVFGAFALSSIVFLKALGFSMALAVLVDATVVRGILVPAFMRVMGRANWWAPRWMQHAVARVGLYEQPRRIPAQP